MLGEQFAWAEGEQIRMTPDQREAFEERAAILEFDAGMTREDAERMAALDVAVAMLEQCKRRRLERQERLGLASDETECPQDAR